MSIKANMTLFDCPYYHLSVEKQMEQIAQHTSTSVMEQIADILSAIDHVKIVTINDFMLSVTYGENGENFKTFTLHVDEIE